MEKTCKYCAMQIPKEAKVCPYCRKRLGTSFVAKAVLSLFLLGAFVSAVGSQINHEPSTTQENQVQKEKDTQDYLVRYAAVEFLKKQLKTPSTADIPDPYSLEVTPKPNKKNTWIVTGTVDAQNSYGAKLRTNFRYTIRKEKDGAMTLVKSESY